MQPEARAEHYMWCLPIKKPVLRTGQAMETQNFFSTYPVDSALRSGSKNSSKFTKRIWYEWCTLDMPQNMYDPANHRIYVVIGWVMGIAQHKLHRPLRAVFCVIGNWRRPCLVNLRELGGSDGGMGIHLLMTGNWSASAGFRAARLVTTSATTPCPSASSLVAASIAWSLRGLWDQASWFTLVQLNLSWWHHWFVLPSQSYSPNSIKRLVNFLET